MFSVFTKVHFSCPEAGILYPQTIVLAFLQHHCCKNRPRYFSSLLYHNHFIQLMKGDHCLTLLFACNCCNLLFHWTIMDFKFGRVVYKLTTVYN